MTALSNIDLNDLDALLAKGLAEGLAAGGGNASSFQLRVLAACLAGEVPAEPFCAAVGNVRAEPGEDGWLLHGRVPAALSSEGVPGHCMVLASSDEGLLSFRLPADARGLQLAPVTSLDGLAACDVDLHGVTAGRSSLLRRLQPDALWPALFALCAEMTGAAGAALDVALQRARSRKVFGRAIGAYQALAHRLVDARMDLDAMQLALDEMVACHHHAEQDEVDRSDTDRSDAGHSDTDRSGAESGDAGLRAHALKALCSLAGPRIVATAQQVHGGEGFYAGLPLQRCTRRVQGLSLRLGSASKQLAVLRQRIASCP